MTDKDKENSDKQKHAKRACERWGLDYKKNPYCIGMLGNNSEIFYPCLKYVK